MRKATGIAKREVVSWLKLHIRRRYTHISVFIWRDIDHIILKRFFSGAIL